MSTGAGDQLYRQLTGGHSRDELPTTIGEAVRTLLGLGVSQERLAERIGIPRRTLRRWAADEVKKPRNANAPAVVAGARKALRDSWVAGRREQIERTSTWEVRGQRVERGVSSPRTVRLDSRHLQPGSGAAVLAAYDRDTPPDGLTLALVRKLDDSASFYGGYLLAGKVDSPDPDEWEDLAYEGMEFDESDYGFQAS
jgi:transcriptional regulator with XRE-family HTH domain